MPADAMSFREYSIGVSGRHLRRQFERAVGVSPKEFGRISRFLRAVQLLSAGSPRSLTGVALDCGFFDQAHFNHEFRERRDEPE